MTMLSSASPQVHADPRTDAVADRLAWLNDSPDNELDDYPGPGWDDQGYEASDEDARLVASAHGDDHDAQPDPFAIEAWAMPNDEWYDAEAMSGDVDPDVALEWYERARVRGHRVHETKGGAL